MPDDPSNLLHDSTQVSRSRAFAAAPGSVLWPGLTVLYHPDLRRVGERALLSELAAGRPERLSRLEPLFAAPSPEALAAPLAHRRLSREPVLLEASGGGVLLRTAGSPIPVLAGGEPVAGERLFEARRGPGLPVQPFPRAPRLEVRAQAFDGHVAAEPAVEGPQDFTHPPHSEPPLEAERSQIAGEGGAVRVRGLLFHGS